MADVKVWRFPRRGFGSVNGRQMIAWHVRCDRCDYGIAASSWGLAMFAARAHILRHPSTPPLWLHPAPDMPRRRWWWPWLR